MVIQSPVPTFPALTPQEIDYDRTVRADIDLFAQHIEKYLAGQITEDEFRAQRLRRGIYSQRQPGVHMVRTKIPGGTLTAGQMRQLARVADEFAGGKGHLTTRQNMQFHFVKLTDVPKLLHMLADVRLTTREACYNTVRNVTADSLAGLLPGEVFDVRPYARLTAFAFLHKELTDNLPRKFKISFSGYPGDPMLAAIHDVGCQAVIRDGKKGFRILIGGGLGPMPQEAHLLDEFLPVENLIPRIEAVLRLFNKHGNRKNRNKARLKFVLKERGWEWVKETIEAEYADILAHGGIPVPESVPEGFGGFLSTPPPLGQGSELPVVDHRAPDPEFDRWLETNVREQVQPGYALVTVVVDQGNLTSDQMRGLARIAEDAGEGLLRFTIEQNVALGFIPIANLRRVYAALKMIGLHAAGAGEIEDVVTCPGAYSCNLALTKTMELGAVLRSILKNHPDKLVRKLKVRASGCPNSCGQHWTGDFGFYGNARKLDGKEVPYYQMLLGGGYDREGIMRYGLAIQSIPARLVPVALERVLDHYVANRLAGETFREYVLRHKVETFKALTADLAKPAETFAELYQDWGDEVAFSLQLGRGECAS
ncbi:MAG: nitrite/sulfite reductase [Bryobacteraceae bacterium]|nr:nitrite/sulfite reductase [Bryobacteraceae bacterium]MDW8377447.1 nitrite/sulfite reductase [Bryobacterales bacterium]